MRIRRTAIVLKPDNSRVFFRAFEFSNRERVLKIIARVMSLSELRMIGGAITVTEAARGISEELSDVELSFAWPSIARSFGATGRFTWRGEVFDASANAGDLLAALSGDRSGLKLRLTGAPFKIAFEGAMSQKPSFKMEGTDHFHRRHRDHVRRKHRAGRQCRRRRDGCCD